jgi:hypothetical protein
MSLFEPFSDYTTHARFLVPHSRPEVLRNVTIEGMGDSRIENNHVSLDHMPQGCQGMDVTLLIDRILPGVLIFDGLQSDCSTQHPQSCHHSPQQEQQKA